MKSKPEIVTKLHNPNDESSSGCYAPLENGILNDKKRQHFNEDEAPENWVRIQCDVSCHLK